MSLRHVPLSRCVPVLVVAGCVLLVLAVVIPSINRARETARKQVSKNNLKQLGIAFHNYHEVYRCLPTGGTVDESGRGHHGWMARMIPQLEASSWYTSVDFDHPWDDPANSDRFFYEFVMFMVPGDIPRWTTEGYGLTHYAGNPRLLHRNGHVEFDDVPAGLAHTWLAGEVAGEYVPWGYPFNWRPLESPLNAGTASFGRPTGDGAQLLIGDGTVRFLANDTDVAVLRRLATAGPEVDAAAMARPAQQFEYADSPRPTDSIELDDLDEGLAVEIWCRRDGTSQSARIGPKTKFGERDANVADVRRIAKGFPTIRELHGAPIVDDEVAAEIVRFPNLVVLHAEAFEVSAAGLRSLRRLPRLRHLIGTGAEDVRSRLESDEGR